MVYIYEYKGTEHTNVKVQKDGRDKIRVEQGETFESEVQHRHYLMEVKPEWTKVDHPLNAPQKKEVKQESPDLLDVLKEQYYKKFGKKAVGRYANDVARLKNKLSS